MVHNGRENATNFSLNFHDYTDNEWGKAITVDEEYVLNFASARALIYASIVHERYTDLRKQTCFLRRIEVEANDECACQTVYQM